MGDGEVGELDAAGVDRDQRDAGQRALLQAGAEDRVGLGRVGAGHDQEPRALDVVEGRGRCAGAGHRGQGLRGGGVADARAAVDVVGAEANPEELLEQVGGLVRRARGRHRAERPGPAVLADLGEAARDEADGLVPGRLAQALAVPDQGCRQAVRRPLVRVGVAALHAEMASVHGRLGDALDAEHAPLRDGHLELAADPAVAAGGPDPLLRRLRDLAVPVAERTGRADLDAGAARDAGALGEALAGAEHEPALSAASLHRVDELPLDLLARVQAATTGDAALALEAQVGVAAVARPRGGGRDPGDPELRHQALELAAGGIGAEPRSWDLADDQPQHLPAQRREPG